MHRFKFVHVCYEPAVYYLQIDKDFFFIYFYTLMI